MTVRSFSDTASVSLAYALSDAANQTELGAAVPFKLVPFTTEGFSMSKTAVNSTAIRGNRRNSGSKNTSGTATGAATVEFGGTQFILDMLQLLMMNTWVNVDDADPTKGKYLIDGSTRQFAVWEKTVKTGGLPTDMQYHERYFGEAINDATIDLSESALITMAMNMLGVFADTAKAAQGANGLGGSMALSKTAPAEYEIADSSNNLQNLVITDSQDAALEMTFSKASLQVQNNVREQKALGSVFASGVGLGKVNVQLSGDVYFYDQTLLDVHLNNERVKGSMEIATREGTFTFLLPNLVAQSPSSNAQGENQDYMTSVTLVAEEGEALIDTVPKTCTMAIIYVPAP